MPNRILKESICSSEEIAELSWFEEVLFYRLIVGCDDYGVYDARAKIIKGSLFPLSSVTEKQIADGLQKLSSVGIVERYEVKGRPYLHLTTWSSHQRLRDSKHKYPTPEEAAESGGSWQPEETCGNMQETAAVRGSSRQLAAARGNLRQLAATCGNSRQLAATRGLNPNPNTNTKKNPIEIPPISPQGEGRAAQSPGMPLPELAAATSRTLRKFDEAAGQFGSISGELLGKAREWVTYKMSRRQPVVETTITALLGELAQKEQQHGTGAVVRAINEAIANGYSGIQWQQIGGKSAPSGRKETMFDKLKRTADELKGEMPCHDDG